MLLVEDFPLRPILMSHASAHQPSLTNRTTAQPKILSSRTQHTTGWLVKHPDIICFNEPTPKPNLQLPFSPDLHRLNTMPVHPLPWFCLRSHCCSSSFLFLLTNKARYHLPSLRQCSFTQCLELSPSPNTALFITRSN